MLGGDHRPPCLLWEGSRAAAEQWELVIRGGRGMVTHGGRGMVTRGGSGMASLVRREGHGISGVLCSPPSTALALHLGSPITIPMGHILLCPLFWGLCV